MTKKIIAVDLEFPNQVEFYGPRPNDKHSTFPKRQKIRGKLRIVTSQPMNLLSVEIRFKGLSQLHWRDPLTHSFLASRMHAGKTLRKSKHVLLKNGTIPSGVTDLGFEITIPGYICSSYQNEYMNVKYTVSGKIIPAAKFAKHVEVERAITIHKTLMPKDIAHGLVSGYQVPRCTMRGKRSGSLSWEFKVPKWACLETDIEFDGILKSLNDKLLVDMIQVDVLQEENYYDEGSDQSRRHLVVCPNVPSTYLHPPLGNSIQFSFPLYTLKKSTLKSTIQDKNRTYVKRDDLNYSLESPFLIVRHFIRIMIYTRYDEPMNTNKSPPICLGLPIYITERIHVVNQAPDALPTYQNVARDGERLPDYMTMMTTTDNDDDEDDDQEQANADDDDDNNDDDDIAVVADHQNGSQQQQQPRRSSPDDLPLRLLDSVFGHSRQSRSSDTATGNQRSMVTDKRGRNLVIQERRLDDFWLVS